VDPQNIICKDGLSLVFKNTDFHPACIKPTSIQKLIQRGWSIDNSSEHPVEIKN
jgi:hypothetical protein